MGLLVATGYRPTVYRDVMAQRELSQPAQLFERFDPAEQDAMLDLHGANRWACLPACMLPSACMHWVLGGGRCSSHRFPAGYCRRRTGMHLLTDVVVQ